MNLTNKNAVQVGFITFTLISLIAFLGLLFNIDNAPLVNTHIMYFLGPLLALNFIVGLSNKSILIWLVTIIDIYFALLTALLILPKTNTPYQIEFNDDIHSLIIFLVGISACQLINAVIPK